MSDPQVSTADLTAPTPAVGDGGPDMVQLLTPEGQRVDAPATTTSTSRTSPTRTCAASTATSSSSAASTPRPPRCSARASSASGPRLLGQEAAQVGSGRAMRPQDYAFPTYREHGVAWCRGVDPLNLLGLFRGVNHGGWDPNEKNFHLYTIVIGAQTLHATGYAMGIQRDGAVGTGDPDRDAAVIAYFGDGATAQGDVSESFVFAAVNNAPDRLLLPEQPVGHLRAQRAADPHPALPARPRLRLPRRAGRRQRRARGVCRDQARARGGPLRPGPDPRRGVHLPDGRPHDLGRPDQVPRLRRGRGRGSCATRSSGSRPTSPTRARPTRTSSTRSTARPTSWPPTSARAA